MLNGARQSDSTVSLLSPLFSVALVQAFDLRLAFSGMSGEGVADALAVLVLAELWLAFGLGGEAVQSHLVS